MALLDTPYSPISHTFGAIPRGMRYEGVDCTQEYLLLVASEASP